MICSDPCYAAHLVTSMNFTNSTCTSAGSINQQEPVPVWICAALILLNIFILIGTLIGFTCLLRFIVTLKQKARVPGHAFFFGISMASLLGSVIGKCVRLFNIHCASFPSRGACHVTFAIMNVHFSLSFDNCTNSTALYFPSKLSSQVLCL